MTVMAAKLGSSEIRDFMHYKKYELIYPYQHEIV
jgi:hypothetical protein